MYVRNRFGGYGGLASNWGAEPPVLTKEMLRPLPEMEMATVGPSPELHDPLIGPMPVVPGSGMPIPMVSRRPQVFVVSQETEKMPSYVLPAVIVFIISLILFKR